MADNVGTCICGRTSPCTSPYGCDHPRIQFDKMVDRVEATRKAFTAQDIAAAEARGFSAGEASMRERAAGVCEDIAKQHVEHAHADDGNKAGVRTHSGIQAVTYAAAAQQIRALKGAT